MIVQNIEWDCTIGELWAVGIERFTKIVLAQVDFFCPATIDRFDFAIEF